MINSFPFPGANVAESKSTIDIAGRKAFIVAGPDGVQIMYLDSGQIIRSIPIPDPASLGLDPSVIVTNAVSVDEKLMFISNGEAGVYVARSPESGVRKALTMINAIRRASQFLVSCALMIYSPLITWHTNQATCMWQQGWAVLR